MLLVENGARVDAVDFDGANALDHAEVALLLDLADTRKLSRQLLVALGERAAKQVVHFNGRPVEIDWVERGAVTSPTPWGRNGSGRLRAASKRPSAASS